MVITAVQLKRLLSTETKLRAVASITIDDMIVIHYIKVLQSEDKLFIAMPSKTVKSMEFKDIVHPINRDTRMSLEQIIFSVYEKATQNNDMFISVRMKIKQNDNILTQNKEQFDVISSSEQYEQNNESQQKQGNGGLINTQNKRIKNDDMFIRWLKM